MATTKNIYNNKKPKAEPAKLIRPRTTVGSRIPLKNLAKFSPSYETTHADMKSIMCWDYARIWVEEHRAWQENMFDPTRPSKPKMFNKMIPTKDITIKENSKTKKAKETIVKDNPKITKTINLPQSNEIHPILKAQKKVTVNMNIKPEKDTRKEKIVKTPANSKKPIANNSKEVPKLKESVKPTEEKDNNYTSKVKLEKKLTDNTNVMPNNDSKKIKNIKEDYKITQKQKLVQDKTTKKDMKVKEIKPTVNTKMDKKVKDNIKPKEVKRNAK